MGENVGTDRHTSLPDRQKGLRKKKADRKRQSADGRYRQGETRRGERSVHQERGSFQYDGPRHQDQLQQDLIEVIFYAKSFNSLKLFA